MIVFVLLLAILTVISIKEKGDNDSDFLDRKSTTTVNGIFAILIFFSHSVQYLSLPNNFLDEYYLAFQRFHNQWVVTTFLAFSGLGVMLKFMSEEGYVKTFPRNRLIKTLLNFDIAVILYLITDALLNISYSKWEIMGSFVGLTSIGNSNWYIFTILVVYFFSYASAKLLKDKYRLIAASVTLLTIIYIIVVHLLGLPSRFGSTAIVYPLGMWVAIYKDSIFRVFRGFNRKSFFVLLVFFAGCLVTYRYRGNIYIKNISSIFFVLIIIWLMAHFEIKSKVLLFCGTHAFSIYILQRLPMIFLSQILTLNMVTNYLFVIVSLIITIVAAVYFDILTKKIDNLIIQRTS